MSLPGLYSCESTSHSQQLNHCPDSLSTYKSYLANYDPTTLTKPHTKTMNNNVDPQIINVPVGIHYD